jgi:hypothetical protein
VTAEAPVDMEQGTLRVLDAGVAAVQSGGDNTTNAKDAMA